MVLTDGTELPAELFVHATSYGSMNGWAAKIITLEVANNVSKCWGLGSGTTKDPGPWEGELRNMWKPTRQPSLWFHGGTLHQSRHYSQFLEGIGEVVVPRKKFDNWATIISLTLGSVKHNIVFKYRTPEGKSVDAVIMGNTL